MKNLLFCYYHFFFPEPLWNKIPIWTTHYLKETDMKFILLFYMLKVLKILELHLCRIAFRKLVIDLQAQISRGSVNVVSPLRENFGILSRNVWQKWFSPLDHHNSKNFFIEHLRVTFFKIIVKVFWALLTFRIEVVHLNQVLDMRIWIIFR